MGIEVPSVYIVPVERFCREMGPVLGINMAEFEFPAYFNYFVRQKRCTLIVDSVEAEKDIRSVFEETLLGPGQFRDKKFPLANVDEDFDPSFPKEARPNFYKEFHNFRTAEDSVDELSVSALLDFVHFDPPSRHSEGSGGKRLGIPPVPEFLFESQERGVRLSDPSQLSERTRKLALFKDDMFLGLPDDERPKLRRQVSESDSVSSSSQSTGRRLSLGSQEALSPRKTDVRRGSLPTDSLRSWNSSVGLFHGKEIATGGGRRESLLSISSALTSMSSMQARSSSFVDSTSSLFPDDFITDDGPELQETTWMYSQAKWLGKSMLGWPSPLSLVALCI